MSNIAVLTSGGDSPGMNAAVVSVARGALKLGMPLIGIKRGFNGILGKGKTWDDDFIRLDLDTVLDIADLPGTYLRTARCSEFLDPAVREKAARLLRSMDVSGLVVIGGNGSFSGAMCLCELGIPCIGIPGTIDNDLAYTEMTLGFDTAVNVCADAVNAIRATSRSHDRPHVVEVMGRHCGDIALMTAAATGSEIVVVPEITWSVDGIAGDLNRQLAAGNPRATVIIAEGCWESMKPFALYPFLSSRGVQVFPGEGMSAERFASCLKYKCGGAEVRSTVVGYTQRGAQPTARDSTFAFESGLMAVELLHNGISNEVIGMRHGKVFHMSIDRALRTHRPFNRRLFDQINSL